MKKSVAVILVLLLLPVAFAAKSYSREVGSGSSFYITGAQALDLPPPPAPPGSEQEQPGSTSGGSTTVDIQNFAFSQQTITITAGQSVTWTNSDSAPHTATSTSGPTSFDTGRLDQGQSKTLQFNTPGTYQYQCGFHPSMTATVIVTAAATQSQPTPPTPEPAQPTTKAAELLEQAQGEVTSLTGRVESLEQKISALSLLPEFEARLNTAEAQGSAASNVGARVDALQSQVGGMKVDLENVKYAANRPVVEQPTFTAGLDALRSSIKTNAIFSLGLAIFALLLVIAVIVTGINQRKTSFQENKRMIKQYLSNYQSQGYPLSTLRMHLRACGWKDEFVEDCLKELG
ncbi:cupredoxin family copper-binding protein [Candidatus Woesearchaeota archaeon]|nr:cupredoxin family copper-binding protein [Candidatus Woesearchaeota archaeon]